MAKRVGKSIYIHYTALNQLDLTEVLDVTSAIEKLPADFRFDIIRYTVDTRVVSFTQSPDWDTANEPTVGDSWTVNLDGTAKFNKSRGQIYHHKWMFVDEDYYTGFDIEESKKRSEIVNRISASVKNRIGYKKFWVQLLEEHKVNL